MQRRPPRIQRHFVSRQYALPPLPALPEEPKINWLSAIFPLVGLGLTGVIMVAAIGVEQLASFVLFIPLMLISSVTPIVTYLVDKRRYERSVAEAAESFEEQLAVSEGELKSLASLEKKTLLNDYPGPKECLQRVVKRSHRLGERRPTDHDFLEVRIGTGFPKSSIEVVKPSVSEHSIEYPAQLAAAEDLASRFDRVDDGPVRVDLATIGILGLHGEPNCTRKLLRSIIVQTATHHWPTEVQVLAYCGSTYIANEHYWINKLPSAYRVGKTAVIEVGENTTFTDSLSTLEDEFRKRRDWLFHQSIADKTENSHLLPALLMIFDGVANPCDYAPFMEVLKSGRKLGVFGLFVTDRFDKIPSQVDAVVSFENGYVSYRETGEDGLVIDSVAPDENSAQLVSDYSQAISQIEWAANADPTAPPERVSLRDLFDGRTLEDLPVETWWDGEHPYGYLRTPLGKFTKSSSFVLDLNEFSKERETHGPHGVIGGMTGSGKSELLRSLILSLALTHHPYDINFALVDYKGGGAFKDLEKLPHVVGVITDIEAHANYANRVIEALTGEVNTRKMILGRSLESSRITRPHIDDYRKLPVRKPLPRLIIIFDEYAEFKDQHPDETQKLINIARQGRSLGVHLILCTQSPVTAIDDQVRQNTKFTVALRVNSPDDSSSLVGIPDACGLPVGQAFIKVTRPARFQVAFTGDKGPEGQTEAHMIVDRIIDAQEKGLKIKRPPSVWPQPLADRLLLPTVLKTLRKKGMRVSWNDSGWEQNEDGLDCVILGLVDDPIHQEQPIYRFAEHEAEHLLVIGGPGSGKSTFLLTAALSIAHTCSPEEAHVYCLDLGGKSLLHKLGQLPHVPDDGGVIAGKDIELMNRLFSEIRNCIVQRKKARAGGASHCRLFLLIDGLSRDFIDSNPGFIEQLKEVILAGHGVGISVIITANLVADVRQVASYIPNRVALRPRDRGAVESVLELPPGSQLSPLLMQDFTPGRGLIGSSTLREVQVALPVGGENAQEFERQLDQLVNDMDGAWGSRPRPGDISSLKNWVSISSLKQESDKYLHTNLGVCRETMQPAGLSLEVDGPTYLITSSEPKLGKTSLLTTWLTSLCSRYPPEDLKLLIVDYHRHSLRFLQSLPHIEPSLTYVQSEGELEDGLSFVCEELNARIEGVNEGYKKDPLRFDIRDYLRSKGYLLIVIDDYGTFERKASSKVEQLRDIVRSGEDYGVRLVMAETLARLRRYFVSDVLEYSSKIGCGVVLGSYDNAEGYFGGLALDSSQTATSFPAGRGYLIKNGRMWLTQFATCGERRVRQEGERQRRNAELVALVDTISRKWEQSL